MAGWLEPGPMVLPVTISLDEPGPVQFNATFEPDDLSSDRINRNNSAVAVTFVGGEGKVLVLERTSEETEYFVRAMQESEIAVDRDIRLAVCALFNAPCDYANTVIPSFFNLYYLYEELQSARPQ